MRREELTCISCPRGCILQVEADGEDLRVTGNACPRGETYAAGEILHPERVLTCLMRPEGAQRPVSVRTDRPVPKDMLLECVRQIYRTHPKLPVHRGDVLMEDLCGTGARVLATRDSENR
jgi:CxxC motif-containing protein